MSLVTICDVCDTRKKEEEAWISVDVDVPFTPIPVDSVPAHSQHLVGMMNDFVMPAHQLRYRRTLHACSPNCLSKIHEVVAELRAEGKP